MPAGRLAKSPCQLSQFSYTYASLSFDACQEKRLSGHGPLGSTSQFVISSVKSMYIRPTSKFQPRYHLLLVLQYVHDYLQCQIGLVLVLVTSFVPEEDARAIVW